MIKIFFIQEKLYDYFVLTKTDAPKYAWEKKSGG